MAGKKAKLTPARLETLRLLTDGWQIGTTRKFDGGTRDWLQKGGVGRGGEARTLRAGTVKALRDAGLIVEATAKYPLCAFDISEAGRNLLRSGQLIQTANSAPESPAFAPKE